MIFEARYNTDPNKLTRGLHGFHSPYLDLLTNYHFCLFTITEKTKDDVRVYTERATTGRKNHSYHSLKHWNPVYIIEWKK